MSRKNRSAPLPQKSAAIVLTGETVRTTWPTRPRTYDMTMAIGRAITIAPRPTFWYLGTNEHDIYAEGVQHAEGATIIASYGWLSRQLTTLPGDLLERLASTPTYALEALIRNAPVSTYPSVHALSLAHQFGATSIEVYGADFVEIDTFSAAPAEAKGELDRLHQESHFHIVADYLQSIGVKVRRITARPYPEWTREDCARFVIRPRTPVQAERGRVAYLAREAGANV